MDNLIHEMQTITDTLIYEFYDSGFLNIKKKISSYKYKYYEGKKM